MVARATRHTKTTLERRKARSSQECNASGLQPWSTLERHNARSSKELENIHLARSSEEDLARANKHCPQVYTRRNRSLERSKAGLSQKTQNTTHARATKPWLERPTQKLDSNTWFTNPTNLKQTCPTHPKTPNEKIKDDNNNYTMTK